MSGSASGSTATLFKDPKNEKPEVEKHDENIYDSKIFRLFTVVLYLAGVSGLGVIISFYHLFLWDSSMPVIAYTKK